jgi:hypothetical protein
MVSSMSNSATAAKTRSSELFTGGHLVWASNWAAYVAQVAQADRRLISNNCLPLAEMTSFRGIGQRAIGIFCSPKAQQQAAALERTKSAPGRMHFPNRNIKLSLPGSVLERTVEVGPNGGTGQPVGLLLERSQRVTGIQAETIGRHKELQGTANPRELLGFMMNVLQYPARQEELLEEGADALRALSEAATLLPSAGHISQVLGESPGAARQRFSEAVLVSSLGVSATFLGIQTQN